MQQKTEVKKRTNKTIVLETQSDEMFRPGTGLLPLWPCDDNYSLLLQKNLQAV
jgi:hypothetical protein